MRLQNDVLTQSHNRIKREADCFGKIRSAFTKCYRLPCSHPPAQEADPIAVIITCYLVRSGHKKMSEEDWLFIFSAWSAVKQKHIPISDIFTLDKHLVESRMLFNLRRQQHFG